MPPPPTTASNTDGVWHKRKGECSYSMIQSTVRYCCCCCFFALVDLHPLTSPSHFGQGAASLLPLSRTDADDNPASLVSAVHQLPLKLAVYNSGMVSSNLEILIVGDSIVRHVTLPGAITYCLSGGKVVDLIELITTLIDLHPTVNIVLTHVGTNDVMARNSSKLHADLESLCFPIESLRRHCLLSGPIPAPSKNSEYFSRLFSLHHWLKDFCSAAGYDFISNFDYF